MGLGWGTRLFAYRAGVGVATVSRFECNRHKTHESTLAKMQETFEREGVIFEKSGVRFPGEASAFVHVKPGALVKVKRSLGGKVNGRPEEVRE